MPIDQLTTPRLTLRLPKKSDAMQICEGLSDPRVNRWLVRVPKPYTLEHASEWIKLTNRSAQEGSSYSVSICSLEHDRVIGGIGLSNINQADRSAEFGYWIARPNWRQGYAFEAAVAICRFAFSTNLKLHRLYAWVHSENPASIRLLEKLGFRREAVCVKASRVTGRWRDDYLYACLRDDLIK